MLWNILFFGPLEDNFTLIYVQAVITDAHPPYRVDRKRRLQMLSIDVVSGTVIAEFEE